MPIFQIWIINCKNNYLYILYNKKLCLLFFFEKEKLCLHAATKYPSLFPLYIYFYLHHVDNRNSIAKVLINLK